MALYDLLNDFVSFETADSFNGSLEDYLEKNKQDKNYNVLSSLLQISEDFKVCRNFPININSKRPANRYIGYRDIEKVNEEHFYAPYIIYWQKDKEQRAVILNENDYIEARGMFYCITATGEILEKYIDELVALYIGDDDLYDHFLKLYNGSNKPTALQRKLDIASLNDPETLKDKCVEIASNICNDVKETLSLLSNDKRSSIIRETVFRIFLLKKTMYVKYMANQKLLKERHSGNVDEQRTFARSYVSEIPFVSYYDLWNVEQKTA